MTPRWIAALVCASTALASGALAQNTTPTAAGAAPSSNGQAPLYDPQQLPAYRGQVQQFTLTPRGDIDGLILTDGTEVKTPPHLSTEIAYSVKPGDTVVIRGLHAAALPLIQAVSVTDQADGRTVIDNGPPGPGPGPGAPPPPAAVPPGGAGPMPGLSEAQGRVRMLLHGPRGEVNGALLEDGTVLRLPPPESYRFASLLQPGQTILAEGIELSNAIGKVLDVQQIGPTRSQLDTVAPPPGPGRGRRPPPPPVAADAPSPVPGAVPPRPR